LNWFTIDFSGLYSQVGVEKTRKQQRSAIVASAICTTAFRCLIVLMIATLIIAPTIYSSISLATILSPPLSIIIIGITFMIINFMLGIQLVIQEAVILRGKVFYE